MRSFTLRGLTLSLPAAEVHGALEKALETGRYEHTEAEAILRHLQPGDRFVDLGAGLGFLCALAAGVLGEAAVTGVEAGPATAALARANLAANGFGAVRVIHAAVVAKGEGTVEFGLRPTFWASSLEGPEGWGPGVRREGVPALPIARLIAEVRPTVLCCDIEGAELEVLARPLPGVRLLVVEIHPGRYGPQGTRRLFDALAAEGFAYSIHGSRGATLVFQRIAE
ncbi:FkbM family methyltransferase [Rhodobacter sp. Har01]|uniref:FkbM family methyltransferase n=1 Tax=Rhodobacter sp. Har01 TaxID=2883999 RepID=UPI001D066962|nr:FkbM family methyltransferase [Rhodobacter sp. Har01]MCB6178458.1 FkbM family methyltransferase [Rhodobacter sp. Har01]